MTHPNEAVISLGALRHNARVLRSLASPAQLCGVVKANAYGHGIGEVAHLLEEEGLEWLAVARIGEAAALRERGIDTRILVLGAPLPGELPLYERHRADVAVTSRSAAERVVAYAEDGGALNVHLEIDTGMHRLGIASAEAEQVTDLLASRERLQLEGLWTHFATAPSLSPDYLDRQIADYEQALERVGRAFRLHHVANSDALLGWRERLDLPENGLVRAGLALYGISGRPEWADYHGLEPAMRLRARVTHVQTLGAGESVSYGRRWTAPTRRRIATLAIGYGDGYPRLLGNRAYVHLGGQDCRVVGAVCMDMILVDLGPPGAEAPAEPGDWAELMHGAGPSVYNLASWAETIPYEICSGLLPRIPRQFTTS